ncbi:MAG: molybdopterin-dependent oxidoreductase [Deltaproteobacteria bacterium]|nr:molybdopterin-dependent oxidoreductase [Deltaproteobacteria bacterium]MBW2445514.1 molybdopterin-dependent oxidoreductase [Deltaproteobacteria bacterium]
MPTEKTFCRYCHANCGILVEIAEGRAVQVRGDRDNAMTRGFTCIKGRSLPDQHAHEDRLRDSQKREGPGRLAPIAVDTAQDEIAAVLRRLIEEHGPRSVALYAGTAVYQSSLTLPFARAWMGALGSPSFYTSLTIDQPNKIVAPQLHGSFLSGTQSFESSDVWMLFGCNSIISMYGGISGFPSFDPTRRLREATARGLDLIVVDPRRTETARMAGLHLPIRPGEDATLLAGMLRVILEEGLYDRDFCQRFVEGVEPLRDSLRGFSRDVVERRTGLEWALVEEAARRFARGPRGIASSGTGPSMAPRSTLSEHLILNLNTLCGRYNRAGDPVANPGVLTSQRDFVEQAMEPYAGFRMEPRSRIRGLGPVAGELPTPALADEILTPGEGQVRALIVMGGNPALSFPDQRKAEEALASLELLVVIDPLVSATAELAHYVIAPTLSLERPDTTLFMDTWYPQPYGMYTPALLEPPEGTLPEWAFLWGLSERLGDLVGDTHLPGGAVDREVMPNADALLDSLTSNARIPLDELRRHPGGAVFDGEPVRVRPGDPEATARMRLFPEEIEFELAELAAEPPVEGAGYHPGEHFTHRLISRRLREVFNSMGRELPAVRAKRTTNPAFMHPDDLEKLGVESGDLVEIASGHGEILAVVEASDDLPHGVISMAHCWGGLPSRPVEVRDGGSNTSRLVDDATDYDRLSGMARQSAIPVNVRPHVGA